KSNADRRRRALDEKCASAHLSLLAPHVLLHERRPQWPGQGVRRFHSGPRWPANRSTGWICADQMNRSWLGYRKPVGDNVPPTGFFAVAHLTVSETKKTAAQESTGSFSRNDVDGRIGSSETGLASDDSGLRRTLGARSRRKHCSSNALQTSRRLVARATPRHSRSDDHDAQAQTETG